MTTIWTPPTDYKGWLNHVFNRPVTKPEWYWEATTEAGWEPAEDEFLTYVAQAFEGFDEKLPWPKRQRLVRAISVLFRDCFSKRCAPVLSTVDGKGGSPLNGVCYMWWDVFPLQGAPDRIIQKDLDQEVLAVMKNALELDHVACQESALHGLGHWATAYPDHVERLVDEFLAHNDDLPPQLKQYALQARSGKVQ